MSEFPEPVRRFHAAMRQLAGIRDVNLDISSLDSICEEAFSLPNEFADLPHAWLRLMPRQKPQVLLKAEFRLVPDRDGWLALEFLAWWVQETSGGGMNVQLRPLARPPVSYDTQLGSTLRFAIEVLLAGPACDPSSVLQVIEELTNSLWQAIEDYRDAFTSPCDFESPDEEDEIDLRTLHLAAQAGDATSQRDYTQRCALGDSSPSMLLPEGQAPRA